MDDQEFGFYMRCLNHSWLNEGLPLDMPELARVMGRTENYLKKIWKRVGKKFVEREGRFVNLKQELQRKESSDYIESRRSNARARWMHMQKPCTDDAHASIMQCPPSPTPSPIKPICASLDAKASSDARQGNLLDESPADNSGVVRPAVSSKKVLTSQQEVWFGEWWAAYWLKKSRADAEKMFGRFVTSEEIFRKVLIATEAQTPEMMRRDPSKRPYGASWLNGKRWGDEIVEELSGIAPSAPYVAPRAKYFDIREITG
jgi:uncharacterized protein YdaU (DUF1376 family)